MTETDTKNPVADKKPAAKKSIKAKRINRVHPMRELPH